MLSSNSKLDRKNFKREPCAVLTVRTKKCSKSFCQ